MINNSPIPTQITDDIQKEVNRIWIEEPGCGVRGLMQKLESLQLASEITKKRVKAAKQAVPYRFVEPENDADGDNGKGEGIGTDNENYNDIDDDNDNDDYTEEIYEGSVGEFYRNLCNGRSVI